VEPNGIGVVAEATILGLTTGTFTGSLPPVMVERRREVSAGLGAEGHAMRWRAAGSREEARQRVRSPQCNYLIVHCTIGAEVEFSSGGGEGAEVGSGG
jgi:hypothetical protein